MPDNRPVRSNGGVSNSSRSSMDKLEEALWRLNIQGSDKQDGVAVGQTGPYPDRPGEPDCIYYLRTGTCGFGSNCRFNHPPYALQGGGQYGGELPERVGQPDCGYFLKTGTCKYGSTCKYHHPRDRYGAVPVYLNILGLPMREEERSCLYYMRNGSCKFGVACRFHHPQPASAGNILPFSGTAIYGSTGSSVLPYSGLPYLTGAPAVSSYSPATNLQGSQTYMPLVLSPPQGLVSAPGWNTYMGTMGTISSGGVLGDSGSNGQLLAPVSDLPQRPDQPECRHFMNTGRCKYGLDCKYDHPRDKVTQFASNSLGPLGLPLRPGQAVCSYYSQYGLCKYGPTCKYDHPLAGYSYSYSFGLPTTLPTPLDPSLLSYQATFSAVISDKFPQKPAAEFFKNQKTGAKISEDLPEEATSSPPSS